MGIQNLRPLVIFLFIFFSQPKSSGAELLLGSFDQKQKTDWKEKVFKGNTHYAFSEKNGRACLSGSSKASASGLYLNKDIDLLKYPVMKWSWFSQTYLEGNDEKQKNGDDFVARVYVIYAPSILVWKTKAINYVWSNQAAVGAHWDNPFTSNAKMLVVESGKENLGKWRSYERNVKNDFKTHFGIDIDEATALAIMVDTDNTQGSAESCFGNISFTAP